MNRLLVLVALVTSTLASAGVLQSSFTPIGYKYPITKISLFKADFTAEQVLYRCSGATSADCLVDVTSATATAAIENSAAGVAIEPGEYAYLNLESCPPGTTGSDTMQVQVKGSVSVGGQLFGTSVAATGGMASSATPEFTPVSLGCGGAKVRLLEPLVVTSGSDQTLTLLIDLTNVTWTDANASAGMGGCRSDNGLGQDLCTTMPFIIPYLGSGNPTFERYLVAHTSGGGTPVLADANGSVNFAVDPSGEVFYVSVAPFLSETSPSPNDSSKGGPDYNTSTRSFSKNTDGSIAFQTGGNAADNRVGFTAFARSTHTGTTKNESSSTVWSYKAFKQ